ncbi:T9SS type A sorting domain-containing protein [Myroides sp. WP-1]|uniref:T9SS type A sorting domain-containing protein n=1 Tax=Myroides sp. WP-1 TaxID=2759944 RepID=UPI0015F946A3|nr:T9SS type A sorting domain-containing protein [Myroides sp. WP-1]MBB1139133.1 T9SS type A sorting domain-containing protein [Myroides sp. WP-1]
MKNNVKLLVLLFPWYATSQTVPEQLVFDYDRAGNQIYRGVVEDSSTSRSLLENINKGPLLKETAQKEKSKLKYYPNPVQEVLFILWDRTVKEVTAIFLYTSNYQVIRKNENLLAKEQTQFDVRALPKGTYFMVVQYADGTKENGTIIKQ